MTIKILGNRILVKETSAEKKTDSGIFLTDSSVPEHSNIWAVIDIGNEISEVDKNDHVIIAPYVGDDIEVEGEKMKMIREDHVLAKVFYN